MNRPPRISIFRLLRRCSVLHPLAQCRSGSCPLGLAVTESRIRSLTASDFATGSYHLLCDFACHGVSAKPKRLPPGEIMRSVFCPHVCALFTFPTLHRAVFQCQVQSSISGDQSVEHGRRVEITAILDRSIHL